MRQLQSSKAQSERALARQMAIRDTLFHTPEIENKLAVFLVRIQQLVAGLPAPGLHVWRRAGIGGNHFQHLPDLNLLDRLGGLDDRNRTKRPRAVKNSVFLECGHVSSPFGLGKPGACFEKKARLGSYRPKTR